MMNRFLVALIAGILPAFRGPGAQARNQHFFGPFHSFCNSGAFFLLEEAKPDT